MSRFRNLLSAAALIFAVSLGCDGSNPTGSSGGSSTGDFTVTVGSGTSPTYTWSSGNAFSVTVARTSDRTSPVWGISTPGAGNIPSPATHGTVPSGAIQTFSTETALTAGVEYQVSVTRLDGTFGTTDFTP